MEEKKLTRLDVIQKVREHFSQPDAEFGYDLTRDECVYRGGNNSKSKIRCAMGVCIPDPLYSSSFEGKAASHVAGNYKRIGSLFASETTTTFLDRIQEMHDSTARAVINELITRDEGIRELMHKLDTAERAIRENR